MPQRSILILDDHAQTGRALERYFQAQGYEAEAFTRVADARAKLAASVPSLMIIDELMPEMTGLQLIEQLRADERTQRVPIVIYSAIADDVLCRRAQPLNVSACWRKGSIDLSRMREQVDRILDGERPAATEAISA
jgi:PleD family two-component response regulator